MNALTKSSTLLNFPSDVVLPIRFKVKHYVDQTRMWRTPNHDVRIRNIAPSGSEV